MLVCLIHFEKYLVLLFIFRFVVLFIPDISIPVITLVLLIFFHDRISRRLINFLNFLFIVNKCFTSYQLFLCLFDIVIFVSMVMLRFDNFVQENKSCYSKENGGNLVVFIDLLQLTQFLVEIWAGRKLLELLFEVGANSWWFFERVMIRVFHGFSNFL